MDERTLRLLVASSRGSGRKAKVPYHTTTFPPTPRRLLINMNTIFQQLSRGWGARFERHGIGCMERDDQVQIITLLFCEFKNHSQEYYNLQSEILLLVREDKIQGNLHDATAVPCADMFHKSPPRRTERIKMPQSLSLLLRLRHVGGGIIRSHGFCFFHDGAPWFF